MIELIKDTNRIYEDALPNNYFLKFSLGAQERGALGNFRCTLKTWVILNALIFLLMSPYENLKYRYLFLFSPNFFISFFEIAFSFASLPSSNDSGSNTAKLTKRERIKKIVNL